MNVRQPRASLWESWAAIAVCGTVLAFGGLTAHAAFSAAPFFGVDEVAHVGYAHAVAHGNLPEVDDPPEIPASSTQWILKHQTNLGTHRATVWVAHHPPLHYVIAAPFVWIGESLDRPDGGLLFLRLLHVAVASIGVGFTYLLGARTAGGSRRIGVLAAALAAVIPLAHEQFGWALNDGTAFAATTALAWAAIKFLEDNSGRNLALLAAFVALASGARSSSMMAALAVVVVVAAVTWRRTEAPRRWRVTTRVALASLAPAVVLFGWFYVRNVVLYGDLAGTERVQELQHLQPRRMWDVLTSGQMWRAVFEGLAQPSVSAFFEPVDSLVRAVIDVAAVAAMAGLLITLVRGPRRRQSDDRCSAAPSALAVNAVVVIAACVSILAFGVAGGPAFSRYLLPALGTLATLIVVGLDRIARMVAPLALIVFLALEAWTYRDDPAAFVPTMPAGLNHSAAGPLPQQVSLGIAVVAAVLVLGGLVVGLLAHPLGLAGAHARREAPTPSSTHHASSGPDHLSRDRRSSSGSQFG